VQEIGGKDSAFMDNLNLFNQCLEQFQSTTFESSEDTSTNYSKGNQLAFYSTGLIADYDKTSSNFTALASLFLIQPSVLPHFQLWNFREQRFHTLLASDNGFLFNHQPCVSTANYAGAHHRRFLGTKSRKGFLLTKWKFGSLEVDLVSNFESDLGDIILVGQYPSVS
jgi:hypothetical protein